MISMITRFKNNVICKSCSKLKPIDNSLIHNKLNGTSCHIKDNYCFDCLSTQLWTSIHSEESLECPLCYDLIRLDDEIVLHLIKYSQ